jgi:hypothetical protein
MNPVAAGLAQQPEDSSGDLTLIFSYYKDLPNDRTV